MPRQPRIEYEGAIYHVMSRGDRREDIVWGDADRESFLKTLAETCRRTGWQVHAFCLMRNHYHLVVETPLANLVAGMKWLLGTYTIRFNARHRVCGHLFSGRYKSLHIDETDPYYLRVACDYVHLNPVHAGLVDDEVKLESYPWSSYPSYLKSPGKRFGWIRTDRLLGEHRIANDNRRGRLEFSRRMESQRREPAAPETKILERGWKLGAENFLSRLLDRMEGLLGENQRAQERHESQAEKAERIIAEALELAGAEESCLEGMLKGDPLKVQIAKSLREQTTVSLKWIAQRLKMGVWTHVSHKLYQERRQNSANTKD